jgi:hypothetical protein
MVTGLSFHHGRMFLSSMKYILTFYNAMKVIPMSLFSLRWEEIERLLFNETFRNQAIVVRHKRHWLCPTTQRFSKDLCNCESLLQILDFLSMAAINKLKGTQRSDRGWYQIAWAFLKVTVEVYLYTINVRSLIILSVVLCTNLLYVLSVSMLEVWFS